MERGHFADEIARRDSAVTAIRHVLEDVAADRYVVPMSLVRGLEVALDALLAAMPAVADESETA